MMFQIWKSHRKTQPRWWHPAAMLSCQSFGIKNFFVRNRWEKATAVGSSGLSQLFRFDKKNNPYGESAAAPAVKSLVKQ